MILLAMTSLGIPSMAQTETTQQVPVLNEKHSEYIPVAQYWKEHNIFQHLDLSVSSGTTGIGIDLASPIGEYFQLRAGFDYMPRFTAKMKFDVMIGDQPARQYDANGNRIETSFDRMQVMLHDFTGVIADDHVDMIGKPTMNNVKLLLDFFPFKNNKHWHVTAGFYWGPSKFAEAVNSTESMNSLIALSIYNNLYDKSYIHINGDEDGNHPPQYILQVPDPDDPDGKMMPVSLDPQIEQRILAFGRMGFHLGDYARDIYDSNGNLLHAKGDPYIMEGDDNNMVKVTAKSNSFKPYLGIGYRGRLVKNRDDWKISVDAGVMFWGGKPDLYLHDGVNLTEDITNIKGQVGDYVDLFKKFTVFPNLSVRFTKTLF
ncbi:hypothetical protein SAMN04487902_101572 [Prevotella sp. ne3005]|nr:hypothetical protein SAMN04487902_101572 [Prevotella sp. ne3005]